MQAEVCTFLLGNFPENLYRALDEETPVGEAVELLDYDECRTMALKVGSRFPHALYVIRAFQVLEVFGPHGRAICDNWCCCCGGFNECGLRTCRKLGTRCNLCGSAAHRADACANKFRKFPYGQNNLVVPDGFCFMCFLPVSFKVGDVLLHESSFTGFHHPHLSSLYIYIMLMYRKRVQARNSGIGHHG